ncbi:MAG: DUF2461 domain-containing protein [Deltaproteobacteria bacterium]
MAVKSGFNGFPEGSVTFYSDLRENNNKQWFDAHKGDFETFVLQPARDFVFEMGKALKKISPGIIADPRVNKSIFRPYRDTRFSKDKTPYKTHLGIFMWEGNRAKMECPGYYLHLEPPHLMLGAGIHCFSKPLLEQYRESVVDPKRGPALAEALQQVKQKGEYSIGVKHYKKMPRGYDAAGENAELLLFNGLTAAFVTDIPKEFYTERLIHYCFEKFRDISPIQKWLLDMIGRIDK